MHPTEKSDQTGKILSWQLHKTRLENRFLCLKRKVEKYFVSILESTSSVAPAIRGQEAAPIA